MPLKFKYFSARKNTSHVLLILGLLLVRSHCSYLAFEIKTVLLSQVTLSIYLIGKPKTFRGLFLMWMLKLKIHSSLSSAAVQHSFKIQCSSEQSSFDTIFMDGNHRRLQCSQSRFVWKFNGICLGAFAECLFLTPWCSVVNSPVLFFGMGSFSWAADSGINVLLSIPRMCPLKLGSWSGLAFLVVPAIKPVCFGLTTQHCTDNLVPDSVNGSDLIHFVDSRIP